MENKKPHITTLWILIGVLWLTQIINSCQDYQTHSQMNHQIDVQYEYQMQVNHQTREGLNQLANTLEQILVGLKGGE